MSPRTLVVCGLTTLVFGRKLYVALKGFDIRGRVSKFVEDLATEPGVSPDLARDAFTFICVDSPSLVAGHTHPSAAAARTTATNFARKTACYIGSGLYILGMSRSDQRKNLRGSRQWYWAKDTNVENRRDCPSPDDIEYICDVDYYIDMPKLLADRSKPTLLYTVVPESAASHVDDTSICFAEDGSLRTYVAGGGSYQHHLWDYSGDSLVAGANSWWFWESKLVTYAIERKQVCTNRQLVLLTPIKQFQGLTALLASLLLDGKRLTRFNPVVTASDGTKFVRFAVHRNDDTYITTGKPGVLLSATIPATEDAAIRAASQLTNQPLQLATVHSWLSRDPDDNKRKEAAMLTEYFRKTGETPLPYVFPVEKAVRSYQYEPHQYDQNLRPKLQAFMSPLVHGAYAPIANDAGERQCKRGRIDNLRKEEPKPNTFRDQCFEEFAELIVGGADLEPVAYDVVYDKQSSPSQRQSLARAGLCGPIVQRVLKCFIKAESYGSIKDPRNISTYNDSDKLDMAQFALAMSEHCKQFPWYGPGKTPLEIAARVTQICSNASFVNISDFHRMDGTISYTLRLVDRCVMMKAFHAHRAKLNELLKRNVDNIGILPNGTTFDQGPSHGSGCSATSLFQTLRAAFAAYLAFRHSIGKTGQRLSPKEAFNSLGIHLGDDGLDADLRPEDHTWACAKVGLVLEAAIIHRGERGVQFLARYYSPEVWFGSPNSMCDVKRQLSKFHTTVRLPYGITPEQKLVEKCMSYVATDGNTPVVGQFCKRVLVLSKYRPQTLLGVGSWWAKFDDSVQYPNRNDANWMDVEFSAQFPEFSRDRFDDWLVTANTIEEILQPPLCADIEPATPSSVSVVVDEQILEPSVPYEESVSSQESSRTRRARRRNAAKKRKPNVKEGKVNPTLEKDTKPTKDGSVRRSKPRTKNRP